MYGGHESQTGVSSESLLLSSPLPSVFSLSPLPPAPPAAEKWGAQGLNKGTYTVHVYLKVTIFKVIYTILQIGNTSGIIIAIFKYVHSRDHDMHDLSA